MDPAPKNMFTSVTFWGQIVLLAAFVFTQFTHRNVDQQLQSDTSQGIVDGVAAISYLVALFGRWRATQPLTLGPSAPKSAPPANKTVGGIILLLLVPLLALSSGCVTAGFTNGVQKQWDPIKETYVYNLSDNSVNMKDPSTGQPLTEGQRALYIQSANSMDSLIAKEMEREKHPFTPLPPTTQPQP